MFILGTGGGPDKSNVTLEMILAKINTNDLTKAQNANQQEKAWWKEKQKREHVNSIEDLLTNSEDSKIDTKIEDLLGKVSSSSSSDGGIKYEYVEKAVNPGKTPPPPITQS